MGVIKLTQVLISIIGAGGMGQWFARFFKDEFSIKIYDINSEKAATVAQNLDILVTKTIPDLVRGCHLLILATPIITINQVINKLLPLLNQDMVLIDIAGIKSPIINSLKQAAQLTNVLSIHPLFGPTTKTVKDKIVILMPVTQGVTSHPWIRKIIDIFYRTGAKLVEICLESHDIQLSHTLNLTHLLNIAFVLTLKKSENSLSTFLQLASTTFRAQLTLAEAVASENIKHYAHLQCLNPYSINVLDQVIESLTELRHVLSQNDVLSLEQILEKNREFLNEDPNLLIAKDKIYHLLEN